MSKTVPVALQTLLESELATTALCWRLTRTDGVVQGYTTHTDDLVIDGVTYEARSGYTPATADNRSDLSVNTIDVTGYVSSEAITEADISAGLLDYAEVLYFVVDYTNVGGSPDEKAILMRGHIGEITLVDGVYIAELRGLSQHLQQRVGETVGGTCRAQFGSGAEVSAVNRCGFDVSTVTVTGEVSSVTDALNFTDDARTEETGYFDFGVITFTSGDNAGFSKEVKRYALTGSPNGANIQVFEAFPYAVVAGDQFDIYPGCDKTPGTCRDTYSNFANFRGDPYLIGNDDLARVGKKGGGSPTDIFN